MNRVIKDIKKKSFQGHRKNCHHQWSDNIATNVSTNKFEEFHVCQKRCGAWRKKVTYFDVDQEFRNETMLTFLKDPSNPINEINFAVLGEINARRRN